MSIASETPLDVLAQIILPPGAGDDLLALATTPSAGALIQGSHVHWSVVACVASGLIATGAIVFAVFHHRAKAAVDEKKRELRAREQLFSRLADATDDIFIMLDPPDFTIEYISPNIERLLGVSPDDMRSGIRALSASAKNPTPPFSSAEALSMQVGDCLTGYRERIHQKTGEVRWYLESLYRENIDGADKFILVLSDRTAERQNTERLQTALAVARESNEAKSQFLANMSHDIRTPINAIVGMAAIARHNVENASKVDECLDVIERSSQHLLGLINDVLDMARIESGQVQMHESSCDVDAIVADVQAIIGPQAAGKHQQLSIDISQATHSAFLADRMRIEQILLNLLSNAVKYTHEGGAVDLIVKNEGDRGKNFMLVSFTVRDTGMGMPPELQKKIFEPFERGGSNVAGIQGTGLGMSITKALVDAMGGTIDVESELGCGSTFRVDLTLRRDLHAQNQSDGADCRAAARQFDVSGAHFLLAEDNDINALVMEELLGERGATIERAADGEEAVATFAAAEAGHFDAVLMDVMMPNMDGYAAARAIRALPNRDARSIPIVALTANAFSSDVKDALSAGMNAHVAKPIDMSDLIATLGRLGAVAHINH